MSCSVPVFCFVTLSLESSLVSSQTNNFLLRQWHLKVIGPRAFQIPYALISLSYYCCYFSLSSCCSYNCQQRHLSSVSVSLHLFIHPLCFTAKCKTLLRSYEDHSFIICNFFFVMLHCCVLESVNMGHPFIFTVKR